MNRRLIMLMIGMQASILIVLIAHLAVTVRWGPQNDRVQTASISAVPIDFVSEYPESADHLLRTMIITNVHLQRFNGTLPGAGVMNDPVVVAWQPAQDRSGRNER